MIQILLSATGLEPSITIQNDENNTVSSGVMVEGLASIDGRFWYSHDYTGTPGAQYHIMIDAGASITETELRYFDFYAWEESANGLTQEEHDRLMNLSTGGGGIVDFTKKNEDVLKEFTEFKKLLKNKSPNPIDYEKIKNIIGSIKIPEPNVDISGISKGWNDNISKLIQSFDTLYKEPLIALKNDMEKRIVEKQEMIDELKKCESKNEQEIAEKNKRIEEMEEEMDEMHENAEDMTRLLEETEQEMEKKKAELKEKLTLSLT